MKREIDNVTTIKKMLSSPSSILAYIKTYVQPMGGGLCRKIIHTYIYIYIHVLIYKNINKQKGNKKNRINQINEKELILETSCIEDGRLKLEKTCLQLPLLTLLVNGCHQHLGLQSAPHGSSYVFICIIVLDIKINMNNFKI